MARAALCFLILVTAACSSSPRSDASPAFDVGDEQGTADSGSDGSRQDVDVALEDMDVPDGTEPVPDAKDTVDVDTSVAQPETSCVPHCEGRVCGNDGCGGSCGSCNNPLDQCVNGACECSLSCQKGLCGVDSCGRYCGCVEGKLCSTDHVCIEPSPSCEEDGFCIIPATLYMIGDNRLPPDAAMIPGLDKHVPAHPVTIGRPFRIQRAEITQADWVELMGGTNPSSHPNCGSACPVSQVTFFDALRYANALSAKGGLETCYTLENCQITKDGYGAECDRATFLGEQCSGYRLPTEAEWELAARAGSQGCFPGGDLTLLTNDCEKHDVIDPYGWYCANSVATYEGANTCPFSNIPSCGLQPVMTKLPNAFGLFDMHGNVSEFTGTLMRQYQDVHEVDPGIDLLFEMGQGIVVRNGQYNTGATKLCSFWRGGPGLDYHSIKAGFIGFRLAQSVQQPD